MNRLGRQWPARRWCPSWVPFGQVRTDIPDSDETAVVGTKPNWQKPVAAISGI